MLTTTTFNQHLFSHKEALIPRTLDDKFPEKSTNQQTTPLPYPEPCPNRRGPGATARPARFDCWMRRFVNPADQLFLHVGGIPHHSHLSARVV